MRAEAIVVALAVVLAAWLWPASARAHHVPGHGSSEGVRSINSLGNRGGKVSTRLLLLEEFSWQPSALTPGLRNELSLLGEYAPVPAFSFGAQLPFTVIDELGSPPSVGYGDTRAFLRVTPHADKLIHRTLTFNLAASFPTRTVRATVDPGRVWSVTPSAIFTRTYTGWYWQAIGLASLETRPAGLAVDVSVGGQAGGKFANNKIALGGGVIVDVRAANFCANPDGTRTYCNDNRAGEDQREPGSVRATALASGSWTIQPRWALIFGVQVPFTPKRDLDLGLTFGVQTMF
ncbi:hypothetical protein ENSA5_32930 [Enhygromyxa salina]|uniref:Uncharacterized protein n=2 Tax=Enhygromyxa salina TaxID=215803 RepID=A0A2S9XXZ2_9BACT|nr:hypothetical protein ENSA5_32930 [Enhygromyxa salina]